MADISRATPSIFSQKKDRKTGEVRVVEVLTPEEIVLTFRMVSGDVKKTGARWHKKPPPGRRRTLFTSQESFSTARQIAKGIFHPQIMESDFRTWMEATADVD